MHRLGTTLRRAGWLLALFAPAQVAAFFLLGGSDGALHLSIAGLEAAVLCWAATARSPIQAAARPAGVVALVIAALLATGGHVRVSVPAWLGPDLTATDALLVVAGIGGLIVGAVGAAAFAAVHGEPGLNRSATLLLILSPIALDLWGTIALMGDEDQLVFGLTLAVLLAIAAGFWLTAAIGALRAAAGADGDVDPSASPRQPELNSAA